MIINLIIIRTIIYTIPIIDHNYLRQLGGYVFLTVCLSICLSVYKITQKVMDGFRLNFQDSLGMIQRPID